MAALQFGAFSWKTPQTLCDTLRRPRGRRGVSEAAKSFKDAIAFAVNRISDSTGVTAALAGAAGIVYGLNYGTIQFDMGFGAGLKAFWYHFAIMFEAMFVLTLIDTGTRVTRYMLQEVGGMVGRVGWGAAAGTEDGDKLDIDFDKAGTKKVMAGFVVPAEQAR